MKVVLLPRAPVLLHVVHKAIETAGIKHNTVPHLPLSNGLCVSKSFLSLVIQNEGSFCVMAFLAAHRFLRDAVRCLRVAVCCVMDERRVALY